MPGETTESNAKYSPMAKQRSLKRDDENAQSLMSGDDDDEITIGKIRSLGDLWRWFMKDPCKRWHIMFFIGIFGLSLVLCIVAAVDADSAYVVSGIAGLVVSIYAAYYFRTLIALKEQVDQFERNNARFKQECSEMSIELDKLRKTKEELETTSLSLDAATKRSKENLEKFEAMEQNMEIMGDKNIEGMSRVSQLAKTISNKWKQELLQQERQLYMDVFEQLELKDNDEDMTRDEYDGFLDTLPPKYRMRLIHQNSFATLAGSDEKVSYKEFADLLDDMARQFAKSPRPAASGASAGGSATQTMTGNGVSDGIVEE